MNGLLLITLVIVVGMLFWRAHGHRERALAITRRYCQQHQLVLLDQSVWLKQLRLAKNEQGQWRWRRVYAFEFTVTGGERYEGSTILITGDPVKMDIPAHRFHQNE